MTHIVGKIEFDCDIEALSEEIEKAGYVKVVRCKDCKYRRNDYDGFGYYECIELRQLMCEDDFCSHGERREADG